MREPAAPLLTGRTAVVTGAGDIGRVIAAVLDSHGASVTVWDRSEEALGRLASEGLELVATRAVDVTSWDQVRIAAAETIRGADAIDVLVNTAAIATFAPVATLDVEDWKRTIDVNLTAVFLSCKAFVTHM